MYTQKYIYGDLKCWERIAEYKFSVVNIKAQRLVFRNISFAILKWISISYRFVGFYLLMIRMVKWQGAEQSLKPNTSQPARVLKLMKSQ